MRAKIALKPTGIRVIDRLTIRRRWRAERVSPGENDANATGAHRLCVVLRAVKQRGISAIYFFIVR